MKHSNFNFFPVTKSGKRIAFNAVTCALATIDDEHFHEYMLIENGEEEKSTLSEERKKEIRQALLMGGFIYNDNAIDEIDIISFSYNKKKYSEEILNLTIAPTMDCNFNCYYCYEKKINKNKKSYMSSTGYCQ